MTKLLRILTGMHAGAELRIGAGFYRVGSDDDADIRISDWRGVDVQLAVDGTGLVSALRLELEPQTAAIADDDATAGADAAAPPERRASEDRPEAAAGGEPAMDPGTVLLVDFVPMQFDDTVLCVGPPDTVWPSDLELLSTLLTKPEERPRRRDTSNRRKVVGIALGCTMLGSIIVIGSVLITMAVSHAAAPHDAADLLGRVNRELSAAHLNELRARVQGSRVIVNGMVASPDEDAAARALLARVSPTAIFRQYDVAQIDVSNLEESLNTQGLQVKYAGRGVFDLGGTVANPADVNTRLARMRHELSPNIKQLRVQLTQSDDNAAPPEAFSVLMTSDGLRYAETPDGVKHIFVSPEASAASAADNGEGAVSELAAASEEAAPGSTAAASGAATAAAPASASSPAAAAMSTASSTSAAMATAPVASAAVVSGLQASQAGNPPRAAKPVHSPAPPMTAYLPLPK